MNARIGLIGNLRDNLLCRRDAQRCFGDVADRDTVLAIEGRFVLEDLPAGRAGVLIRVTVSEDTLDDSFLWNWPSSM